LISSGFPISDEAEAVSDDQAPVADEDRSETGSKTPFYAASLCAMLITRIYEVLPLVCPQYGGQLKIVAFLTEADPIQRMLIYSHTASNRASTRAAGLAGIGF
jgi:hypothetical protein